MENKGIGLSAQEMYEYCIKNGFGSGFTETWGIKHFKLIEKSIMQDEIVLMTFIGLHNFIGMTKHDGYFAYAVTNKRIIMAQKRLIGEAIQTISLEKINDITLVSKLTFGILTIDTIKEVFNIALDKARARNINSAIYEVFENARKPINTETNKTSVADELLKFKNLLDLGVINQQEFDKKKEELLKL